MKIKPDIHNYKKRSKTYDKGLLYGWFLPKSLRSTALLISGVKPGDRVLDLCTGTGQAAAWFKAAGATVTGIDLSEDMLAVAKRNYKDITFKVMDASTIDFPNQSFDIVNIQACLHEMPAHLIRRVLSEACRVTCRVVVIGEQYIPRNTILRAFVRYLWLLEAMESPYWKEYTNLDMREAFYGAGLAVMSEKAIVAGLFRVFLCQPMLELSNRTVKA